jgi:4a-hydroxytetrahydrobiopterin dehydratase
MWQEKDNSLQTSLTFENFARAFAFMTEVALHAERHDHHPDWRNVWNRVDIRLQTHSAGNVVTDKDRELATAIETIYLKYR